MFKNTHPIPGRGLAFFDFDGTLIEGDSFMPFLAEAVGGKEVRRSLVKAINKAAFQHMTGRHQGQDFRTNIKAALLYQLLRGVPVVDAHQAAQRLAGQIRWKTRLVEALHEHKAAGHTVVVATGALDVYMPALLVPLGVNVDHVLATGLQVENGVFTGYMTSEGNCVRHGKAARVKAWLETHGPWDHTWGYGNKPHDLPMLELVQNRVVV